MGQRPGPYDRPIMGRGGFFGPGPGRGGAVLDQMRSGGGYSGGKCTSLGDSIGVLV